MVTERVKLSDYWNESPTVEDIDLPSYYTRREEQDIIENFLRGTHGCLLVCGKRGVGKSSMIANAVNTIKRMVESQPIISRKIIPVLVNAPSFKIGQGRGKKGEETDVKRLILQNLVRRLFHAAEKVGIEDEMGITELFDKAVAKEVREEKNFQDLERQQDLVERRTMINLRITKKMIYMLFFITLGFVLYLNPYFAQALDRLLDTIPYGAYLKSIGIEGNELNLLISFLIGLLPTISIAIKWDESKTIDVRSEKKISRYYLFDFDTNSLESELDETLRILDDPAYRTRKYEQKRSRALLRQATFNKKTKERRKLALKMIQERDPTYEPNRRERIIQWIDDFTWFNDEWYYQPINFVLYGVYIPVYVSNWITKRTRIKKQGYDIPMLPYYADISYKVIFIVDELDKIENEDIIIEAIESLKTLLTRSSALFILVGGQDFYNTIQNRINTKRKLGVYEDLPMEYTLFSEILYIGTPLSDFIGKYLDAIIAEPSPLEKEEYEMIQMYPRTEENKQIKTDEFTPSIRRQWESYQARKWIRMPDEQRKRYEKFKKFISFQSRGLFFDAHKIIKERLHYEVQNEVGSYAQYQYPYLDISLSDYEKNIAKLQSILEAVYSKNIRTEADRYSDECVISFLYSFLHTYLSVPQGGSFKLSVLDDKCVIQFHGFSSLSLESRLTTPLHDLIGRFQYNGLLKAENNDTFVKSPRVRNRRDQ